MFPVSNSNIIFKTVNNFLNVDNNKFINFSNQFVYSSQNSSNSVNLTFEKYATSKLSTLN